KETGMSAAKRKGRILAGVAALVLAGMSAGTQQVAHEFHYPREFGGGLFDVGAHRIYAPWKIVPWSIAYGTAYRKAFDAAQLTAFGVVMFPMLIGIGIMRRR